MTENKSFLESMAATQKPESFADEKFEYIKDTGRTKKLVALGMIALIVIAGLFAITYLTGRVSVPNLIGMSLDDAYLWAQQNKVPLAIKNAYSFDVIENVILAQDTTAGVSIKKNTMMSVVVSLGPDPEETIAFPDLENMMLAEIETWVNDNKLTGVRIETTNSDVIHENQVISYSFTDGTEDNFKRKNRVTITVSRGSATLSETVMIEDFTNFKVAAVLQWANDNGVAITLSEAFDSYISAGTVISQSIKKGTEIKRTDAITVVISKGKSVTVPNFTNLLREEASTWAKLNNITLTFIERYSNSHNKGNIYNQNITSGKAMQEGDEIKLYYSLGRVDVSSFLGKTKLDILNWQQDVNGKGANISLTFSEAFGDRGTAGTIIHQSIKSDLVNTGTAIAVGLSKGMRLVTPDFSGKTEEEVKERSKEMGINVIYDYQYNENIERGLATSQSIAKDTLISDADTITVVISLGNNET